MISEWLELGYKRNEKTTAFTIRLPVRCVEIIDQLIEAGIARASHTAGLAKLGD